VVKVWKIPTKRPVSEYKQYTFITGTYPRGYRIELHQKSTPTDSAQTQVRGLLGGKLLVAPVFSDGTALFYLPGGKWTWYVISSYNVFQPARLTTSFTIASGKKKSSKDRDGPRRQTILSLRSPSMCERTLCFALARRMLVFPTMITAV
jgi:hypothetical protein